MFTQESPKASPIIGKVSCRCFWMDRRMNEWLLQAHEYVYLSDSGREKRTGAFIQLWIAFFLLGPSPHL